jgi:hypothetical protein
MTIFSLSSPATKFRLRLIGLCSVLLLCGCSALQQFAAMSMRVDPNLEATGAPLDMQVTTTRGAISGMQVGDFVVSSIDTEVDQKTGYDFGFSEKREGEFEFEFALTEAGQPSGKVVCQGGYHLNRTQSDYFRIQLEKGDVGFVCGMKDAAADAAEWRLALKGVRRTNLNGRYLSDGRVYRVASSTTHHHAGLEVGMVMGYHIYERDTVIAAVETAAVQKKLWVAPDYQPAQAALARTASALVILESLVPHIRSALGP